MNQREYADRIIKVFKPKLNKLNHVKLTNMIDTLLTIKKEIGYKEKDTVVSDSMIHNLVNSPYVINKSDYSKCLDINNEVKGKGWIPVVDIPSDLFHTWWSIVEINENIILDEERDYQFFQVLDTKETEIAGKLS